MDTDETVEQILRSYDTITVVGASNDPAKPAHYVPDHMREHGWRIIPVNPRGGTILDTEAYPTLADVPEQVGLVDVFRPSLQTPDVARQAVAAGATALWLQLHIASDEARRIAEDAGLLYVENRCLIIEQRRLRLDAPEGMTMDASTAADFLRANHHAVMATFRKDGRPALSPVTVAVDPEGRVQISTRETAMKVKHLRRDPRVALTAFTDAFYGEFVQVEGTAEIVDLPEAMELLVDYYRSVAGEHPDWDDYRAAMVRDQRVIVRFAIERAGPNVQG